MDVDEMTDSQHDGPIPIQWASLSGSLPPVPVAWLVWRVGTGSEREGWVVIYGATV